MEICTFELLSRHEVVGRVLTARKIGTLQTTRVILLHESLSVSRGGWKTSARSSSVRLSSKEFPPLLWIAPALKHPYSSFPNGFRSFYASCRPQNEVPKSPFQTFAEVLREKLCKNHELQVNVKQLQEDVDKLQDSGAMRYV
ncbi:hypothetical protein EDC04DRAFT_2023300 [Pisolithus marmoratus]|nr:hypothetical protein EDC04DRAFT_2023300 [Pisolithus marmoratus]